MNRRHFVTTAAAIVLGTQLPETLLAAARAVSFGGSGGQKDMHPDRVRELRADPATLQGKPDFAIAPAFFAWRVWDGDDSIWRVSTLSPRGVGYEEYGLEYPLTRRARRSQCHVAPDKTVDHIIGALKQYKGLTSLDETVVKVLLGMMNQNAATHGQFPPLTTLRVQTDCEHAQALTHGAPRVSSHAAEWLVDAYDPWLRP